MDSATVFAKTEKGREEIEKRSYHLDFRHRTALIQVDGENSVAVLQGKIPGDGQALLEDLSRDGFIAIVAGKSGAQPARASASGGGDVDAEPGLEEAKRNAVRVLEQVLGPGGESFAMAIEGSNTMADFLKHAQRTRDIISQVGGPRKAAEFWAATGQPPGAK